MPSCSLVFLFAMWAPRIPALWRSQYRVSNSLSPALPRGPCSETPDSRGLYVASSRVPGWKACLQPRLGKGPEPHSGPARALTGLWLIEASFFLESSLFPLIFTSLWVILMWKEWKQEMGVILNSFWVLFWDLLSYGPFWLDWIMFIFLFFGHAVWHVGS